MSLPVEIESIREALSREVESAGAELLEIYFRRVGAKSTITFVVDRPGGITLDQCVEVNRHLGRFFDEHSGGHQAQSKDLIEGSYYLEVSSPGLDRPLRTEKDFSRVIGQEIRVVSREESGRTLTRIGNVVAVDSEKLKLDISDNVFIELPFASIIKATREIKFKR